MKKLLMTLAAAASACALFADCGGEDGSQTCTYYDGERVWSLDRSTTWVSGEQIDYWSVKGVNPAPEGTLEIPYRLGDFNVIGISGGAFANATNLTTVVVGDGVLYIDADAFANCEKLDDITLPSGMAWIHCDAFRGTKAEEKNADKGFQIGEYFIKYTGDKSKFSIPSDVKMICDFAFCSYATNSTGEYALKEVEIPEGVETIGMCAFKPVDGACALEKIELPDSVTVVGDSAFAVGESLKTVKLGAGITDISFINNWIAALPGEVLPVQYEDLMVDMFEDAELADDECGQVFGDNSEATCQEGEPRSDQNRRSLWFRWTAPRSGLVSMEIVDGDFDTVLGVYQGAEVTDLTTVAYNDDYNGSLSKLAFDAIEGEEYFIYVAGYSEGSYGWFELDWSYEKSAVAANWVEKLILGNGVVEIPEETFYGTGWNCLNTVEFGEALTCIGSCAFADCTTLSNVNFKTAVNLSGMGSWAFAESAVTEVDLSECTQLAELPNYAFARCPNLAKVVFNEGLESIGSGCFAGCEKLEKVEFPGSLKRIIGLSDDEEDEETSGAFQDCDALKTVTFNEGLEEIGAWSFSSCDALEQLAFPASLKIIGPCAFRVCDALAKVTFNEGLETIGDNAFEGYNAIDKLEFPASLKTIGEEAFLDCTNVTKVTFAENSVLEKLGGWAFENLVKLEKIEIPASVTTIDGYLFDGCEKLEKVEGGDGVIFCESSMFGDCPFARFGEFDEEGKELKNEIVTFGKVVIGLRGKCPKSIGAADFGEEIVQIAPDVFSWSSNNSVSNLTSVTFPETLEVIGARAFSGAANLKDVVFGENTEALDIGDEAFRGTGIKELEGTFHQIGSSAFRDCTDLKTVLVTVQATKFTNEDGEDDFNGGFVDSSAFAGCTNLVSADVSALGVEIANSCETGVSGGSIYSSVFSSCTALAEVRLVADGVLNYSVFNSCGTNALKKLEIDATSIPWNLAKDQKALDTLVLGDRVEWIGSSAFQGCEKLGTVVIPAAVTVIGSSAFRGCVKLDAVEIPAAVTTIEAFAFEGCVKLGTVTGCESVERVERAAFENTDFITGAGKGALQVGCVLFRWIDSKEGETAEIDESVLTLAYGAFTSNTVAKVVVPSGIVRVEAGTFVSCSGLQVVEFANPDVLLSTGAAVDCDPQPQWVASKGGFIFKGFVPWSYEYLRAQFEKVRFHNDPNEDGAFAAGATYVGWIMRGDAVVGSITVKTGKPDAKGQSKVTATVQLPGSKKAYTSLFEVDPETGKAKSVDGYYSDLYGMILGGKWMSGTVNFAGANYTVRGGSDVSNTAAFDSYVGHVWAAALSSVGERDYWNDCYTALCNGYSSIVVTPAKKGKIKVTGLLADGTKVSTTAQMVAGDHGMVAAPVSLQLYQGKKGGFSFLLQFYMDNGKPKMYFDDGSADGSIGTWYYQLPDHWKPFANVGVWVSAVGEIDVNGAGFKTPKACVALGEEGYSSYEALCRATKGNLVSAYRYEECDTTFSVDSVDVAVDAAKGKWTLPKAGKLSLLDKPEAYAAFIADSIWSWSDGEDWGWIGNFAPDGKYLQPYWGKDGSDTPTCCDLNTVTPTHWLVYDLGSKLDKKSNQVTLGANTNEGAWKLSYAKKSGQFSGSMQYYWVDTSKAEKHALKKGKATVGGVVIDGVAYGTAAIKDVCSFAVCGEDVETE